MEESGITQKQVGGDVEQSDWRSNSKNFTGSLHKYCLLKRLLNK